MLTKIEKLLLEMLKIPSVSGQEKEIGNFIVSQLDGFRVKKQYVAKDRFNIIAKKGKSDLWIVVHMDTVPGAVPIKITKDKVYGRGAIDNKGNIVGAIMAGKKIDNINLLFTVGEEENFCGAKKANIKNGKFIVMEPTKLKIITGQRGIILLEVTARGIQKHSSLCREKEESAVYNLTDTLMELYRKNWTAFNAFITFGGEADNVCASMARAKISIRPKDMKEYKDVMTFLGKFKKRNASLKIEKSIEPCLSRLVKNGKIALFFSEMAFFKNSILFGVGDIKIAHSANEYVLRKDLNRLEKKLLGVIEKIDRK